MISVPSNIAGIRHQMRIRDMAKDKGCSYQVAALWVWMDWTAAAEMDIARDLTRPQWARYEIDHPAWRERVQRVQASILALLGAALVRERPAVTN